MLSRLNIIQKLAFIGVNMIILILIVNSVNYYYITNLEKSSLVIYEELLNVNPEAVDSEHYAIQEVADAARQMSIITFSIAITMAVILVIVVGRSLIRPIRELQDVMKRAEAGDLTVRGTYEARDEIHQLTKSYNTMLSSIQEVISKITSSGSEVAAASEQLTANAEETLKGTEVVAGTMEGMASGTDDQLREVTETATVVTEFSTGVNQIMEHTEQVSVVVNATSEKALSGKAAIGRTVNQMESIQSTFEGLSGTIKGLGESSDEIGTIIKSITTIADQTNLLALNAAIEAARAGEHGKGFAVVADEVRKLAEESSRSAQQISDLIGKIQQETNKAVDSMEQTSKEVVEGMNVVHVAGGTFEDIDSSIREINTKMEQVSHAMQYMETGSHKIVDAFELIKEITETVSAGTQNVSATTEEQLASMEEISSSAQSLSSIAEELQEMVRKFKV